MDVSGKKALHYLLTTKIISAIIRIDANVDAAISI